MAPAFVARIMLNLYVCVCVCAFVCRTLSYVGYTFLVECCVVWGHFYKVMFDLCVCVCAYLGKHTEWTPRACHCWYSKYHTTRETLNLICRIPTEIIWLDL